MISRTQHRGRTVEEIELMVEVAKNNDGQNGLEDIREQTKNAVARKREVLQSSIKVLERTEFDIFYRSI